MSDAFWTAATTGSTTRLAPNLLRIVASNPSALTGPGTNSYVIGSAPPYLVVDPGPDDAPHVDNLLLETQASIAAILCTHSHPDHSPGAAALHAVTQAPVYGRPAPDDGHQDRSYAPQGTLEDGQCFDVAGARVRCLHTPGHASNHVCLLFEPEGWLVTGDHLMSGSTVVILPPDGSMRLYLESLERLRQLPLNALLPGHGAAMPEPIAEIDKVIAHRHKRERKVIDALVALGGRATVAALVPIVYDDTPVKLHGLAKYSLEAHLQKLTEEGRAVRDGADWQWHGP